MKNFLFAAIAALALSLSVGSAYAAQASSQDNGSQATRSAPALIPYGGTGG